MQSDRKRTLLSSCRHCSTSIEKIPDSTAALKNWPECAGVKRLAQHQYQYRLRVGRYRVLFDVAADVKIISIEEVKKRNERTY